MLECSHFFEKLKGQDFEFYAGVPDSLLKNFCFYVSDHLPSDKHIITANEGSAVGLACGYHMATGKIPVVYLQNSGIGNTVNPLLSIADPEVYGIPMLLIVGWRGEPGVKDEPQHKKQGRVMLELVKGMEIPYSIIDGASDIDAELAKAMQTLRENRPYVFAVREGAFGDYKLQAKAKNDFPMTREGAIEAVLDLTGPNDVVVCTTGKASRELYELRIKRQEAARADFLTVGAMGHCSQIALGVALNKPNKKVFCLDGDGAMLMHMGGLATIGRLAPKNFIHVMINNGAHESVGGQETGAFDLDWISIAKAAGYRAAYKATNTSELASVVKTVATLTGPVFIEACTSQGSRKELGRPKSTPLENKQQFMTALSK
jgi:phosphonopyruvate decarboxylase